jgi:hypothetical protein
LEKVKPDLKSPIPDGPLKRLLAILTNKNVFIRWRQGSVVG